MAKPYTRKDLLDLFKADYPEPQGYNKIKGVYISSANTPQLLQVQTLSFKGAGSRKIRSDIEKKKATNFHPKNIATAAAQSAPVQWYYLDQSKKVQGPFAADQLRSWWDSNMFPHDLMVSSQKTDIGQFKPVKEVFTDANFAFLYNPALFTFIGSKTENTDDLQKLVLSFDAEE